MTKSFSFLLGLIVMITNGLHAQTITIASARNASAGSSVHIKGIVTNGSELGTIRYIQDETAGAALYSFSMAGSVNRGDSLDVTGTFVDYNGLLEMNPVSSFTILNSSNTLPTPLLLTPLQLGESNESQLVRIHNVTFAQGGSTFSGGLSYIFTDLNGESSTIFVRTGSPLVGQLIPTSTVDLVGISSQYTTSYQLLCRDMNDIISSSAINITSSVTTSQIALNGFHLSWQTDVAGTSNVFYGLTPSLELGQISGTGTSQSHDLQLTGLMSGEIYYCQAFSTAGNDTAFSAIRPFGTESLSSGNMKVYFNSSVDTTVSTGQNANWLYRAIDDTLVAYINRAEVSIDLTIYDFNNANITSVSAALNAAFDRGVRVRFISDGSMNPTNLGLLDLYPQIPVLISPTTSDYNIQHNKFVVFDAMHSNPEKAIVWTGSTNWTDRQINRDNNSVVIIHDQTLAKSYTLEFEEMWGSTEALPNSATSKFGQYKTDNTPHEFKINGKRVESYFSPSDATNNQILNSISTAEQEIYVSSMLITRNDVANALVNQDNLGRIVKVLVDDSTSTSQWSVLRNGLPINNLTADLDSSTIMHHKYMIVDPNFTGQDPLVWVGSHNWTTSANSKNDENSLVIHDALIANQYYQEFNARFNHMSSDTTTALDVEAPIIACMDTLQFELTPPNNLANLTIPVPSVTDNDGVSNLTNNYTFSENASGFYGLGNTSVTWSATDFSGNIATCTTIIHVTQIQDLQPPVIICLDNIVLEIPSGTTTADVSIDQPFTDDNIGVAQLTNSFTGTNDASGSYPIGTTIITWTATDVSGNTAQCEMTVTVSVIQTVSDMAQGSKVLSIYPNPVAGSNHFTIEGLQNKYSTIRIFNSNGMLITTNQANASERISLQVPSSPGIYTVLITAENSVNTIKLVIE